MIPRTKYLGIHNAFCQQEQERENTKTKHIESKKMLADMGTKPLAGPPHKRYAHWACGVRYYPPANHPQYKHMRLQHFDLPYLTIAKSKKEKSKDPQDLVNSSSNTLDVPRVEEGRELADGIGLPPVACPSVDDTMA